MDTNQSGMGYKIWAVDGVVYGPVDMPTLIEWTRDERVLPDTWVFVEAQDMWQKAAQIQELNPCLKAPGGKAVAQPIPGLSLGALRRIKILADLSPQQIERFALLMEVQSARQWQEICKQGEPGNAMYMVLDGELRVRLMIGGKETILATLGAGEFFGEMSLYDRAPRSADVVANKDSTLLKVSNANFEKLLARAPELAAPILFAIGKTLVARIRADNKRYKDSVNFARTAGL